MTSRHAAFTTDGLTHASNVIAVVNCNDGAFGIVTNPLVPLNVSAPPFFPAAVHVAPTTVPVLPVPDASPAVVPAPSLNPYAATRPAVWAEADMAPQKETATRTAAVRATWR